MSDLIERDKAIETVYQLRKKPADDEWKAWVKRLNAIPSARPKGEWIKHEHGFWTFVNDRGERDGWLPDYECNLCGSRAWRYATNFCPNCGAKMKGSDDE